MTELPVLDCQFLDQTLKPAPPAVMAVRVELVEEKKADTSTFNPSAIKVGHNDMPLPRL